ncbi:Uncharacterised protein [Klebsiella pneumoniae]|uniref:Uncharacterized protein n=1 Tax=Klebsiella pneumoniae TaxID=573 RepID=A0A378FY82_KLEPN|nr:Uncharacterised protein [Klebsiella pneumoniae]
MSGCANNIGLNPETNVSKFDGVKTVTIHRMEQMLYVNWSVLDRKSA